MQLFFQLLAHVQPAMTAFFDSMVLAKTGFKPLRFDQIGAFQALEKIVFLLSNGVA